MHALYVNELFEYAKRLRFTLIFVSRNEKYNLHNGLYIMNLDDIQGGGTHYVAFYVKTNIIEYFDTYGLPPPNDLVRKKGARSLYYNSLEYQDRKSSTCGYFCLFFLYYIQRISFYDFLYNTLQPFNVRKNENLIYKWFKDIKI